MRLGQEILLHTELMKRTFVYNKPNFKSNPITYLPMGSMIYVKEFKDTWAKINLIIKNLDILLLMI